MPPKKSLVRKQDKKEVYQTRQGASGRMGEGQWWLQPKDAVHLELWPLVKLIKNREAMRRWQLAVHAKAYSNFQSVGFNTSLFTAITRPNQFRISVNVVKSCVDTATARIAQNKPRVFLLPNQGDFELEERAKKLQLFLDGSFKAAHVYTNSQDVFRDSCVYGTGHILLRPEEGEIQSVAVKADEILVDQVDGMYGDPQMIYWDHWVRKDELLALYPECKEEINSAQNHYRGEAPFISRVDHVPVVEAWRKPSKSGAKDGMHVVTICNATLLAEPWDKSYLPIIPYHWTPPLYGYWGQGIALELEGLQLSINETMRNIQRSLRLFAIPRVFVDAQAQVSQQMINDISINQYSGTPPTFITPPAMAADVYQYLQWQYQLAFQQIGLSQMSAQSEKPAGLDSAVAMRTYQNVETQRFAMQGQRWEEFHVKVAEIDIDMSKDLYARTKKLSVQVPGREFIETIDFGKVNLKRDQYMLMAWPTNLLPIEPEGRLAMVQEMGNSGIMPQDVLVSQLNLPILNDWISDETAPRDNIKMAIRRIVVEGKYVPPDSIQNLSMAVNMAKNALLRAECNEAPPDRLDMLRRFMNDAQAMLDSANQPPPQQAPQGQGAPVGQAPAPPPAPLAPQGSGPVSAPPQ